jgi:predicted O-methyltransferase YrrM
MPAPARKVLSLSLPIALVTVFVSFVVDAGPGGTADLDARVEKFLESHDWGRGDMNVPTVDGRTLHDIIVKNKYTKALEIGTSTGHSAIWIAWALSKTGGKLITLEIEERRYREALGNFEAAGLSEFVDARLGDAHEIVPALEGPFDFVFSDADKGWYKDYFDALLPKLEVGGCYTSHNVSIDGTARNARIPRSPPWRAQPRNHSRRKRRRPVDQLQKARAAGNRRYLQPPGVSRLPRHTTAGIQPPGVSAVCRLGDE